MNNIINTFFDLKLNNGETVKVTLNFARLYALRSRKPELYNKYSSIKSRMNKHTDDFDMIYIVYTAFLCANSESDMSFEEFLELLPTDLSIISDLITDLIAPSKKNEISQKRSKKQHQN